jgi:hypothetical protein
LAQFEDHINQAKSNLEFLHKVNQQISNHHDWQVTICFYVAVHLANAHISNNGVHYRKHTDVNNALNPENLTSLCKLPQDEYVSYIALHNLSRRSRYLVNDNMKESDSEKVFFTHEKHFARAIRHLDKLLSYFSTHYQMTFDTFAINCSSINYNEKLSFFKK